MAIVRYDVGGCCVFKTRRVRGRFPSCVSPYPEEGSIQSRRKGLHVGVSDALSKSTSDPFGQEHLATNTKGGGGGNTEKEKNVHLLFHWSRSSNPVRVLAGWR